ncbi:MAG: TonB-dependent receptor plug domain-containing protein [Spirochaetes bacterium]|nr:TonB-dependent receptor plug domain-containing protein [Spirochaetota bacterium]
MKKSCCLFIFSILFISGSALQAQNIKNDAKNESRNVINTPADKSTSASGETQKSDDPANDKPEEKSVLKPLVIRGSRARDRKKPEIQSISRQTMTAEDMKEVPASFGDSVSALTSLPGITREGGSIFGDLVIRGADPMGNKYFVDDIPLYDPLHFGGIHSVINTNMIKDIDVYSSAFPAEFGSATSAVINISTVDRVNDYGGYFDISLLSVNTLLKAPILKDNNNNFVLNRPLTGDDNDIQNSGYAIASGRYGYLGLAIKASDKITGDDTPISPEYWDYQFKMKYNLCTVHSATIFLFGFKDFIRMIMKDDVMEEGDDPYMSDAKMRYERISHNQGLYFDSKFSNHFNNRILFYGSLTDIKEYYNFPATGAASWAKDLGVHSKPWIFGLKDKFKVKWLDSHAELNGSAEYTYYYFTAKGNTLMNKGMSPIFDPGDEDAFYKYNLDEKIINHVYGGYLENKFVFSGLTVTPGIRSDHLVRTGETTFDPRAMASYKFATDTTIAAAGGHYSYFPQVNPYIFGENTDIAGLGKKLKSEKAWHSSISIEQEIGSVAVKIEGFSNYFYDKPLAYPHTEADGTYFPGLCSGKEKTRGFEIMLRKDSEESNNGFFGWMSYTYTRAKFKSGLPTTEFYQGIDQGYVGDEYGDKWITSDYEQQHNFKLVAGYRLNKHILSGRFQYCSGFSYSPITGHDYDDDYHNETGKDRYIPVTGYRNSKNYPSYYSLDLRYTHKTNHSWGNVSWYIEVINILMKKQVNTQKWYWDRPYAEGSNPKNESDNPLIFMPNLGVEIKF